MKQIVVLTAPFPDIATSILSRDFEVTQHPAELRNEEDLITILAEADGALTLLTDPLSRRVMESNPNLRAIANCAVGTDNIDLVAAGELGVTVTNTPDVLTYDTADMTMAMILALTRRVVEGDALLRKGEFHGWQPLLLLGSSLRGKRLGIIGMGRIGTEVGRRASAFGMEIVYKSGSGRPVIDLPEAREVSTSELLETSDIVSLHCPLTDETRHLIDDAALHRMKRSAFLVNVARGPVVDEEALARALHEKTIAGAAVDVYEREPSVHPALLTAPSTLLLPHIASATVETRSRMAEIAATDLALVLNGRPPHHPVGGPR